jgi:hypothetical protein
VEKPKHSGTGIFQEEGLAKTECNHGSSELTSLHMLLIAPIGKIRTVIAIEL